MRRRERGVEHAAPSASAARPGPSSNAPIRPSPSRSSGSPGVWITAAGTPATRRAPAAAPRRRRPRRRGGGKRARAGHRRRRRRHQPARIFVRVGPGRGQGAAGRSRQDRSPAAMPISATTIRPICRAAGWSRCEGFSVWKVTVRSQSGHRREDAAVVGGDAARQVDRDADLRAASASTAKRRRRPPSSSGRGRARCRTRRRPAAARPPPRQCPDRAGPAPRTPRGGFALRLGRPRPARHPRAASVRRPHSRRRHYCPGRTGPAPAAARHSARSPRPRPGRRAPSASRPACRRRSPLPRPRASRRRSE